MNHHPFNSIPSPAPLSKMAPCATAQIHKIVLACLPELRSAFALGRVRFLSLFFAFLALPPLPLGAQDEDLEEALMNLEELEGEERIATIKELCQSEDEEVAQALISVLLRPKPEDAEEIQEKVFQKLLAVRSKEIVPELNQVLRAEESQPKVYAVRLLARALGPDAFETVQEQLGSESLVRTSAIKAIGDCQHPDGPKLLKQLLKDPKTSADDTVFVRMSLVKLGDAAELSHLLESYQNIIAEALRLEDRGKYLDTPAAKTRNTSRIKFLWKLEKELRVYFSELPDSMIPVLVETLETTASEEGVQLVFELLPRLMSPERCSTFAPMLFSRFFGIRQLALYYFLKWDNAGLKNTAQDAIRKYLASSDWAERRLGLMYTSALPGDERWKALEAATRDSMLWVRIESVRELGRWRTAEALRLIEKVASEAADEQLQFSCRVVLAGLSEDLHGLR